MQARGQSVTWLNAAAVSLCLCTLGGLLLLIAVRGLGHFWPADLGLYVYQDDSGAKRQVLGELVDVERVSRRQQLESNSASPPPGDGQDALERLVIKTGNRRWAPPGFVRIYRHRVLEVSFPPEATVLERREWGNAHGMVVAVKGIPLATGTDPWPAFRQLLADADRIRADIERLEGPAVSAEGMDVSAEEMDASAEDLATWTENMAVSPEDATASPGRQAQLHRLHLALNDRTFSFRLPSGRLVEASAADVLRAWRPNQMSLAEKLLHYGETLLLFLTQPPREANMEGGVFPAILGTVMMVLLMSVLVTPLGVIAAVYLHEYAHRGPFVRLLRIAVNNLAGVPSIIYGVFGLGFFVYWMGDSIDQAFFAERLPAPTFGAPGLLWASLTLALLTLPVVVVSVEEGLSRIPRSLREASEALGATQAETLFRLTLPAAAPSVLTGLILAVARAAGEVAPLMLVGVVKLAPDLPIDGEFPYLHLERRFMHLGFHIFDVGFQSPNVEAARPLVYATALLLVAVILTLNLTAILLRNRLEARYGNA